MESKKFLSAVVLWLCNIHMYRNSVILILETKHFCFMFLLRWFIIFPVKFILWIYGESSIKNYFTTYIVACRSLAIVLASYKIALMYFSLFLYSCLLQNLYKLKESVFDTKQDATKYLVSKYQKIFIFNC